MGHTVTICRQFRGKGFVNFDELQQKRKELTEILIHYLEEKPCIAGSPEVFEGVNSYADSLAQHYVTLLKSEITGHRGDKAESLASMAALGMVFSEMWGEAYAALNKNQEIISHPFMVGYKQTSERNRLLDISLIQAVSAIEAQRTKILLARSYCKALTELQSCASGNEKSIIKHHTSLVGDLMDEMLNLVQYLSQNNIESEFSLPPSHPHWLAMPDEKI
jgi:hypothetical protein